MSTRTPSEPLLNAEAVRHKIVEHTVGAGRFFACRCLCGWDALAYYLDDLDALADAHIDGVEGEFDGEEDCRRWP